MTLTFPCTSFLDCRSCSTFCRSCCRGRSTWPCSCNHPSTWCSRCRCCIICLNNTKTSAHLSLKISSSLLLLTHTYCFLVHSCKAGDCNDKSSVHLPSETLSPSPTQPPQPAKYQIVMLDSPLSKTAGSSPPDWQQYIVAVLKAQAPAVAQEVPVAPTC